MAKAQQSWGARIDRRSLDATRNGWLCNASWMQCEEGVAPLPIRHLRLRGKNAVKPRLHGTNSFLGVFSKRRNHATDERRTRPGHRTVSVRLSSSRKLSGFKNQKRFECFYLHKEYIVQREQARPRAVECSTHLTSHRRRNHMHYLARLLPLSQPRAAASQPTRHRIAHASSARSRGEDGSGWATPSTPAPCFFFFFLRCSLCTWPFHEACRTWAACNSTSVPV